MATEDQIHEGGCACGAVRFSVRGAPLRAGLCHCMTCRKSHGGAFNPFVVFALDQVDVEGELADCQSSPSYVQRFCPKCGSQLSGGDGEEIELSLGSFDQPGLFEPQYELWVIRREHWLAPLDVPQFNGNRDPG
jgi:hypothetical protein